MNSELTFCPDAYDPRLPSAVSREVALVNDIRRKLGEAGAFVRHGRRLMFRRHRGGRPVVVDCRSGSSWQRLFAAIVGLSPRTPQVSRVLHVIVSEAVEMTGSGVKK